MSVRAATSEILIGLIDSLLVSDNQPIAEHYALSMQCWQGGKPAMDWAVLVMLAVEPWSARL
jgi:hypothetical protein